ncbi:quinone oxidoreductase [Sphingosinicella microcystinivorans]|uniref:NADPH2:quinone reductase n=2 Tax=Sphingosinicella microcystinivorans TaxID=335406 RepID=A0AAD1D3R3_SPHMI|nr:quinone oxidoreductase [Sphingosinicella microcystinivorans]RKS85571.1 NADPH2:quinone reductase [Sphingosinicella microcystinivorans]BBE33135.1 quinone oxidoreductase [Sphingosinicella microcystinivorans]
MAYRMAFQKTGAPEVIARQDFGPDAPRPGELAIRHTAIGVNFIDTYHRSGLYPVPLPAAPGIEAAGIVEAIGEGVSGFTVGDRIGYFTAKPGAYATHRNIPAAQALRLPDTLSDEDAAAVMLKAATTEYLIERCAHMKAGDAALVHAAAGGVGLLLVQWLKAIGVRVVATAGSAEKQALARSAGADVVCDYADAATTAREMTEGAGVNAVFDGVGKATWDVSLSALRPRGLLVSFGNASGPVTGVDLGVLAARGSLFVTRPTVAHYYATPSDFQAGTTRFMEMLATGKLKADSHQRRALADAAQVHRDLEARKTTGATIMLP